MESASIAHDAHAAHPPEANQSSRIDHRLLGVLLFIISEAMLFGSFFTMYFFVRAVQNAPWPPEPFEFPVLVASMNTAILLVSSGTVYSTFSTVFRPSFLAVLSKNSQSIPVSGWIVPKTRFLVVKSPDHFAVSPLS